MQPTGVRLIESSSARLRLTEARTFVETHLACGDVWIVAASRSAADDFARTIALGTGATMGLHRFSLTQLALRLAAPVLVALDRAPATFLGSEAVAARATFDALHNNELTYFAPVARTPGFPRALARTVYELRLARVDPNGSPRCRSAAAISKRCCTDSRRSSTAPARSIARRWSRRRPPRCRHTGLFPGSHPRRSCCSTCRSIHKWSWTSCARCSTQLPAPRFPLPASGFRLPASGSRLPNLRSRIPDPRPLIPVPRSRIPDPRSLIPVPRSPFPDP